MEKIEIINNRVYLILPDCKYKPKRHIGDLEKDVFYIYRRGNHIYNINESIGIAYKFIMHSPDNLFKFICVNHNLWTSRLKFILKGLYVEYKKNGLEKQKHLKITQFLNSRAEAEAELKELEGINPQKYVETLANKLRNVSRGFKALQGGLFN